MSIFTSNNLEYLLEKVIFVVLTTVILIVVGHIAARYLSKGWFKDDVKLSPDEMEKMNILSPISEKDLLNMFKQ